MQILRARKEKTKTRIRFLYEDEARRVPDFKAGGDEVSVRYDGTATEILCGLGKREDFSPQVIRSQAARAISRVRGIERKTCDFTLPEISGRAEAAHKAAVEGIFLGGYSFERHKTEKTGALETVRVKGLKIPGLLVDRIATVCQSVHYSRDLVNDNAHEITPERLAAEAHAIGETGAVKVRVLDENQIHDQCLGLLEAVGQGSLYPPRLILMEYNGMPRRKDKTAIIGKGITFDSGGQDLKPPTGILTMRMDMAGAAAVLGIMKALAVLRPTVNVVGVASAAQNAIGRRSYFPGDVYRSYSGKTVEIGNTDAEGRLVLADAISFCIKHYKPTRIVDFATLTGAVLIALGDTVAGLLSNNDDLADTLARAGADECERLWRLPLDPEHEKAMKSDIADLNNVAKLPRGYAGTIIGGAFLKAFVEDTPWAHVDIAGTAWNDREARGEVPKYATGFGVRLMMRYLGVI